MTSTRKNISGKRVGVLGGKRSGVAVAALMKRQGAEVFVSDSESLSDETKNTLGETEIRFEDRGHTDAVLDQADFLVLSPGVPSTASIVQDAVNRQIPVYSEIEAASWYCAAPVVAITGSNGKTTTTSLAAHTFNLSGRRTFAGGNIGVPFSSFCEEADSSAIVVLEVSSFQLDHIDTFRPVTSVLLNITPDHLNRYENNFNKYAAAKLRIMENQGSGDFVVYNIEDTETRTRVENATNIGAVRPFAFGLQPHNEEGGFVKDNCIVIRINSREESLMHVSDTALRGRHNLYNTLAAAVTARVLDVRNEIIRDSIRTFEGVPHRLEFVADIDGVQYYNDSKATNVNAGWYALESFSEPIILIAGGRDKGNDYSEIADLVRDKVKILIAIGEGAPKLIDELGDLVETVTHVEEMEDAVRFARVMAEPGEVVLLSPACASFDMFDNYEQRGEVYKNLVNGMRTT